MKESNLPSLPKDHFYGGISQDGENICVKTPYGDIWVSVNSLSGHPTIGLKTLFALSLGGVVVEIVECGKISI